MWKEIVFPVRLEKYLSLAGVASRRKSAEIIKSGGVKVDGITATEPGFRVQKGADVKCGGKEIKIAERVYVMLNKPRGVCCTSEDSHAEIKVADIVKMHGIRLFTAGRLDKDSEGLLILTNDGEYAAKLTHPKYGILKKYEVMTDKCLSEKDIKTMRDGIYDDGEFLHVRRVKKINSRNYIFVMSEGKKREIRRLIERVNGKTNRLKRIAIGGLHLGHLPPGKWRLLGQDDIKSSLKSITRPC